MTKPDISGVSIVPNPVVSNGTYKISVTVQEKEIEYIKVIEYAGEIYCNQQIGVI